MDKTGKIVIALAILTLVGWQFYQFKHPAPQPQESSLTAKSSNAPAPAAAPQSSPLANPTAGTATTAQPTAAQSASQQPSASSPQTGKAVSTAVPAKVPEKTENLKSGGKEGVDFTFTNLGGGIKTAVLKGQIAENKVEVAMNRDSSVAIGAVSEKPDEGTNAPAKISVVNPQKVIAVSEFAPGVKLTKTYSLPAATAKGKERYLVKLDLAFENSAQQPFKTDGYFVSTGSSTPIHANDQETYTAFDWSKKGSATDTSVSWFGGNHLLSFIKKSEDHSSYFKDAEEASPVSWAAVKSQYYTTIVTPDTQKGESVWAARFPVKLHNKDDWGIRGALGMPGFSLKPNETIQQHFTIYTGPKQYSYLKSLGNDQQGAMQFGMFGFIAIPLLNCMNWLAKIFGGNYALAIIVLTIIIKGLLWFPQNKATQSMKRMQLLQPRMKELREKLRDDPTRMNQETMKLYKQYGINPVGGCLPMLVQIPIFFGFYALLRTAFELRDSTFLWVKDLSQPDTVGHIAGFPINILPVLMAITMLWQMSLTPKSGDSMQQRVMMFIPLVFVVFCYNYASALSLYLTISYLFSVVQLYLTRNQQPPTLEKVKAPAKQPMQRKKGKRA